MWGCFASVLTTYFKKLQSFLLDELPLASGMLPIFFDFLANTVEPVKWVVYVVEFTFASTIQLLLDLVLCLMCRFPVFINVVY